MSESRRLASCSWHSDAMTRVHDTVECRNLRQSTTVHTTYVYNDALNPVLLPLFTTAGTCGWQLINNNNNNNNNNSNNNNNNNNNNNDNNNNNNNNDDDNNNNK